MKKKIILGCFILCTLLLVIVAFENIASSANLRFIVPEIANGFVYTSLVGLLGFMSGFFLMLYAEEVRRLNDSEDEDVVRADDTVESTDKRQSDTEPDLEDEEEDIDSDDIDNFDEDEEVLG
jgi:TRAP-type C4-dicarboxylate transport system permease small subunit